MPKAIAPAAKRYATLPLRGSKLREGGSLRPNAKRYATLRERYTTPWGKQAT